MAEPARNLEINSNMLGRWKQPFADEVSGARLNGDEREELKRQRKENRTPRMEEILILGTPDLQSKHEVAQNRSEFDAIDSPPRGLIGEYR